MSFADDLGDDLKMEIDDLDEEELEEELDEELEDFAEELGLDEDDEGDPVCRVCGCTQALPCPRGCVWAEPDLCSQCVRL